jgi:hypothetical protein
VIIAGRLSMKMLGTPEISSAWTAKPASIKEGSATSTQSDPRSAWQVHHIEGERTITRQPTPHGVMATKSCGHKPERPSRWSKVGDTHSREGGFETAVTVLCNENFLLLVSQRGFSHGERCALRGKYQENQRLTGPLGHVSPGPAVAGAH